MKNRKLLVVIDESPATKKTLQYVAEIVAKRSNFRLCLAHSLPNPPPELVELRGAESQRLQAYKQQWIAVEEIAEQHAEQHALKWANEVLLKGGVSRGAVEAHYCYLVDGALATKEILELARAQKCDTVVIGRKSLSWLSELIDGDPAEDLVREGKGFTIWVVE